MNLYLNLFKSINSSDNVEMEIVLPGLMNVMESHDIALALQHKIEAIVDVERYENLKRIFVTKWSFFLSNHLILRLSISSEKSAT
jgi:hypothetical protein